MGCIRQARFLRPRSSAAPGRAHRSKAAAVLLQLFSQVSLAYNLSFHEMAQDSSPQAQWSSLIRQLLEALKLEQEGHAERMHEAAEIILALLHDIWRQMSITKLVLVSHSILRPFGNLETFYIVFVSLWCE